LVNFGRICIGKAYGEFDTEMLALTMRQSTLPAHGRSAITEVFLTAEWLVPEYRSHDIEELAAFTGQDPAACLKRL
jgi:hypothetical protein